MPVRVLTEAERGRLSAFPKEIPTEDLFSYFTLTGPNRAAIPARSAPANRLGFALSLCTVRYLGFCPEDLAGAPGDVVWYVSEQLGVPAEALKSYGERPQTRTDHLLEVHRHLGYRRPSEAELADLSRWLVERALEHDDPSLLVRTAAERLKAEKLVRPGLWLLERMVADARERAYEETFRAVSPLLTPETRAGLDGLLVAETPSRPTPLARLGRGATSNTPKAILKQLAKLDLLRRMGADRWDLSAVNPNRLKRLSRLGRRYTAQALERQTPERRYPILLAFLRDSSAEITDEVVDLVDACLAQADARARRELEEFRRGAARATNEKVALFRQIGRLLLDPGVPDERVRAAAYDLGGSPERLLRAVEECERLARPVDDNYFDFLAQRYSHVRQFAPAFLSAFDFRGGRAGDPLLAAVELLREMNAAGKRLVPDDAPLGFVPAKWGPYVVGAGGRIDRRYWELCVLTALRWALRSGDVWVEGSRRYADPQSYLIPKERWPGMRPEVRVLTGSSHDGVEHLEGCRAELAEALARLEDGASRGNRVQVQADKLVFRRDRSEGLPESAAALSGEVGARLPKVELADLLVEVDRWTGFLGAFEHAAGSEPRGKDLHVHLLASVLARATNLGPSNMAELSGLSYRSLAWAANW